MRRCYAVFTLNIAYYLDNGRRIIINEYLLEHKVRIFGTLSIQLLIRKSCSNFGET